MDTPLPDIFRAPIRIVTPAFVYVYGLDRSDSKWKLFLLDATTGITVSTANVDRLCPGSLYCNVVLAPDGTIYMNLDINNPGILLKISGGPGTVIPLVPPVHGGGTDHQSCPSGRQTTAWGGAYGGPDPQRCEGSGGHAGVDLNDLNVGEPTYSIGLGTVVKVGKDPKGFGNYVVVRYDRVSYSGCTDCSVYAIWAHLDSVDAAVIQDETVGLDQRIGVIGKSGKAFGTHLHFQMQSSWSGKPYWPRYTASNGKTVSYPASTRDVKKLSDGQRLEAAGNVQANTLNPLVVVGTGRQTLK